VLPFGHGEEGVELIQRDLRPRPGGPPGPLGRAPLRVVVLGEWGKIRHGSAQQNGIIRLPGLIMWIPACRTRLWTEFARPTGRNAHGMEGYAL
jgi:hypothetical protein